MTYNGYYSASYSYYTFRPQLISESLHDRTSDYHVRMVSKLDPVAFGIIQNVAQFLTSENPQFFSKEKEAALPQVPGEPQIEGAPEQQAEMEIPDWGNFDDNNLLKDCLREARLFAYCIVSLFDEEPFYRIYSGEHIASVKCNAIGKPIEADVIYPNPIPKVKSGGAIRLTLKIDDVNNFWIYNEKKYEGISALSAIWDDITYMRYSIDNMAFHDMRLGSGSIFIETDPDYQPTEAEVAQFRSNMDYLSSKYVNPLLPGQHLAPLVAGPTNFPEHIKLHMQRIVAATGFPERFFTGEATGTLSTSDEDSNRVQTRLRQIYSNFKYFIKKYVKARYGLEVYDVQPVIGESLSEQEQQEYLETSNKMGIQKEGQTNVATGTKTRSKNRG